MPRAEHLWDAIRAHPRLTLVALTLAIHAPFIGGGFLTDDFLHLERLERQTLAGVFVSPDTFGFYRPLPQASLLANLLVAGPNATLMRLTNVLIHGMVISAAYAAARVLLGRSRSAFLATLAFALTPKAHPVAVLWISARAELLMAFLSVTSVICWVRWQRGDGRGWVALAWMCYLTALTCKETAVLLPVLLIFTPPAGRYLTRARVLAAAGMLSTAAFLLIARLQTGALMPASPDAHYNLATPVWRWLRNARNYFWRAIVSPLALVVLTGTARVNTMSPRSRLPRIVPPVLHLSYYALLWYFVFILPVLPIVARSEHYLYLPVFGLCLLAGSVADALVGSRRLRDAPVATAVAVFVMAAGGFQVSRAAALHADAAFSAKFLAAVRQSDSIAAHRGSVVIIPANDVTRRFLQDSIGGYIGTAVDRALGRHVPAGLSSDVTRGEADALHLSCLYENGQVTLRVLRP